MFCALNQLAYVSFIKAEFGYSIGSPHVGFI
jgi:hypothetical protein